MEKNKIALKKVRLVVVPLDKIDPNDIQPHERTTDAAMKTLIEMIKKTRYIAPPSLIKTGARWMLFDGHRRVLAAVMLGLTELLCIELLPDAEDPHGDKTFVRSNKGQRVFNGRMYLSSLSKEPPERRAALINEFPAMTAARIRSLIRYLGVTDFYRVIDKINSPVLVYWIEKLAAVLRHHNLSYDMKSLTLWIILHSGLSKFQIESLDKEMGAVQRRHAKAVWSAYVAGKPYKQKQSRRTAPSMDTIESAAEPLSFH